MMRRPRSRRVQAQRKFAQGAYVPPNALAVTAVSDNRRDAAPKNITINPVSVASFLDVMSMQGLHTHLRPVVLVERLHGSTLSVKAAQENIQRNKKPGYVVKKKTVLSKLPQTNRKQKDYNRSHVMCLRSRKPEKKNSDSNFSKIPKRKVQAVPQKPPKRKRPYAEPSEFSLDDNRPLTYFAKCSTPKQPAHETVVQQPAPATVVQQPAHATAEPQFRIIHKEPVAGPSGLQHNGEETSSVSYYSNNKIHRWMNESLPPGSHRPEQIEDAARDATETAGKATTQKPCVARNWKTVQNVINAPKNELDSRCHLCRSCVRIAKVITLSTLLKTQVTHLPESSNNENDESLTTAEADPENLYLELLPRHPNIMMKLRIHSVLGKEILSACLIPRCNAHNNKHDFLLQEHEHLLDHLIETLMMSLSKKSQDPNLTISTLRSEASDDATPTPEKQKERQLAEEKRLSRRQKEMTAEARLKKAGETQAQRLAAKAEASRIAAEKAGEMQALGIAEKSEASRIAAEKAGEMQAQRIAEKAEASRIAAEKAGEMRVQRIAEKAEASRIAAEKAGEMQAQRIAEKAEASRIAVEKAGEMQARRLAEKAEASRIAAEKAGEMQAQRIAEKAEASRIAAEKEAEKLAEVSRIEAEKRAELERLEAEKNAEISRLEEMVRARIRAEVEAEVRMMVEVDQQAKALEAEKDAKSMDAGPSRDGDGAGGSSSQVSESKFLDAPVYRPTEEEFNDPMEYFEKIWPEATKFGICKIVPPADWTPTSKIMDDLRFKVSNQYISRLFNRWGPATRELCAIRLCLQQQKIQFARVPLLEGVEVNLAKLYHVVQRNGGLQEVINRKKWGKVAEEMKFNKTPVTERRLDQIYVKYLLSYDTLAHHERQDVMRMVEKAWHKKNQKLLDRALNPLHHQKRMLGLSPESEDESDDENTSIALKEAEDCITSGASMNRAKFKRIATIAYENMIGSRSEAEPPSLAQIEEQYWNHVIFNSEHLCVHTAAIDTGQEGHGFTKNKNDAYGRHPWNLKNFSQNPRNVLRYLGSVLGVTVPTLHLGMLYSTSCWHKDPHLLPWIEYGHSGPSRIWYGIPSHQTDNFRKAVETLCPTFCQNKGLWLSSDIAMIPPSILRQHNVALTRTTQDEGEFILAFPNAYTCCISTGYTESESVYFAPPSWLQNIPHVFKETRESCEPTMFSMEQLIYLMAKDQNLDPSILRVIQPIYDKMLRDEVNNRQMLQERGLKFSHEPIDAPRRKHNVTWNARDHDECEYCRATLFLSKVKGLTSRSSTLCLEHALKLLDTDLYKNISVRQLEVEVNISVRELNAIGDDMKNRLGNSS